MPLLRKRRFRPSHAALYVPAASALLDGSESDGTNLLASPAAAMTSGWTTQQATFTNATTTSPDGNTTGSSLIEAANTARHIIFQSMVTVNTNANRHVSIYAKQGTRRYLQLLTNDQGGSKLAYAYFDLQTGSVTDSAGVGGASISNVTITAAVNGFYKCEFDFTLTGGNPDNPYMILAMSDRATQAGGGTSNGNASYAGDGTSLLYLWRPKYT